MLPAKIDDSALPDYLISQPDFDFQRNGWNRAYDGLTVILQRRTNSSLVLRPLNSLQRRQWGS